MQTIPDPGEVFLIDKPLTWTSFDVVKKMKGILKSKKIGHAGTLDPLATGLLVVCTGKKTKTIPIIQDAEKEYTGTIYIGATTPSFDKETEFDQEFETDHVNLKVLNIAVKSLTGPLMQVPPMHSAVKLNGKRAYELARKGESVELAAKPIIIKEFEITRFELPEVDFRIVCTKGTYIRSIARDLGKALHSGAHLTALCRTRIGSYTLKNAVTIDDLKAKQQIING
jgi:tRNA pseudouridine55 synthase